jgi:hypothetical protein
LTWAKRGSGLSMGGTEQPLKFQAFKHSWLCSQDEICLSCLAYTTPLRQKNKNMIMLTHKTVTCFYYLIMYDSGNINMHYHFNGCFYFFIYS